MGRTTGSADRPGRASATARIVGFGAASVLVFTAAWTAGSARHESAAAAPVIDDRALPARSGPPPEQVAGGVLSTAAGYTLAPVEQLFTRGEPAELAFRITGSDGAPVLRFDTPGDGTPVMDVAVLRRDVAGYLRLRAVPGPDGVWRAPVTFPGEGVWRLYAAFTPTGGPRLDLGTDVHVPGPYGAFRFPAEDRSGLCGGSDEQVRLDGALVPGGRSRLFATVGRDGAPVTALEPLPDGSFGRLTAVRRGDLARVELRPEVTGASGADRAGPGIAFSATVPDAGGHRLFLDYRSGGVLRSCEFSLPTSPGS
ncbi:hypothetical protein [Pseudonocardia sp. HH130630-07]|uniref:hypothetical protein n=1 Tax=Pseudonocardia sp. HH130630-07 TaxID=1690815 RepID=UPI000814FD97|nr:hypothetical protein [Pseudonocardia sp. HH130630-07]ANY05934.1 hypothetical protein AFB00_06025 [Pseudonocardia sp. HH130630-07]